MSLEDRVSKLCQGFADEFSENMVPSAREKLVHTMMEEIVPSLLKVLEVWPEEDFCLVASNPERFDFEGFFLVSENLYVSLAKGERAFRAVGLKNAVNAVSLSGHVAGFQHPALELSVTLAQGEQIKAVATWSNSERVERIFMKFFLPNLCNSR